VFVSGMAVVAKLFINLNSCEILLTDLTSHAVRVYKYQFQLIDKSWSLSPALPPPSSSLSSSSSSSSVLTPDEWIDKLLPNVIMCLLW